ncbi:MAG TPA: DUF177 domain-containing protein [Ignavibacteriaceae bacterium]|nr:DUF177 domain-containing protein [Ignavibacteriaceae bacterium]
MIIKIANLSEGNHEIRFDESIENLGVEEPFHGNCKVDVELSKANNQIILKADLSLNANFECDRCGIEFGSPVNSKYQMVYLFGNRPDGAEDANLTYLFPDADKIDISNDVRDYALLAIPMKKLCKEDCKGLCPKCGKNLNEGNCNCSNDETDPRWKPLMELKNKLN